MAKEIKNSNSLDLSTYQFDSSKYLQLNWGVVRDAATGQLVKRGVSDISDAPKKRA